MSGTTSGVEFTIRGDDADMRVYRGKTIDFEVVWADADGVPIDIGGWTARLQVRDANNGRLMLEMSTANGKASIDGPNGRIAFIGSADDSRGVNAPGKYELELYTPAGKVYRALSGKVMPVEEIVK